MKNKIPDILKSKSLTISEFHRSLIRGNKTSMSYPIAYELATSDFIRETMEIGMLKRVAVLFGVTFNDLVVINEDS